MWGDPIPGPSPLAARRPPVSAHCFDSSRELRAPCAPRSRSPGATFSTPRTRWLHSQPAACPVTVAPLRAASRALVSTDARADRGGDGQRAELHVRPRRHYRRVHEACVQKAVSGTFWGARRVRGRPSSPVTPADMDPPSSPPPPATYASTDASSPWPTRTGLIPCSARAASSSPPSTSRTRPIYLTSAWANASRCGTRRPRPPVSLPPTPMYPARCGTRPRCARSRSSTSCHRAPSARGARLASPRTRRRGTTMRRAAASSATMRAPAAVARPYGAASRPRSSGSDPPSSPSQPATYAALAPAMPRRAAAARPPFPTPPLSPAAPALGARDGHHVPRHGWR